MAVTRNPARPHAHQPQTARPGWSTDLDHLPVTVNVVDDDAALGATIMRHLERCGHLCRHFASAEDFLANYNPALPHALLLDLGLPEMGGLELLSHLADAEQTLPTLVLSGSDAVANVVTCMKHGVVNFLPKPPQFGALTKMAATLVSQGPPAARERRISQHLRACRQKLTQREAEVLPLVLEGLTPAQVAHSLGIRPRTAHIHCANVLKTFGVETSSELIRLILIRSSRQEYTDLD